MLTLFRRLAARLLTPTGAGVVTAIAIGGVAGAITDSSFLYSPPKVGYFSTHSAALVPDDYRFYRRFFQGSTVIRCYSSMVTLPQGSEIENVTLWYSSTFDRETIRTFFVRETLDTGVMFQLAKFYLDTNRTGRRSVTVPVRKSGAVVDNQRYGYALIQCQGYDFPAAARITYRYTSAGD